MSRTGLFLFVILCLAVFAFVTSLLMMLCSILAPEGEAKALRVAARHGSAPPRRPDALRYWCDECNDYHTDDCFPFDEEPD